jgi:hypothetical protein
MSFAKSIAENTRKPCSAPDCSKPRFRLSTCCRIHAYAAATYGHALGRPFKPKEYAAELKEVSTLIDLNPGHPSVTASIAWFRDWMDRAWVNEPGTLAVRAMQGFHEAGIQPVTLLKTVMAIWVFADRHPAVLPDDERLDRALSLACLGLIPRQSRTSRTGKRAYARYDGCSRRELGKEIRFQLSQVFANVKLAVDAKWQAKQELLKGFRVPLALALSTMPKGH